MSNLTDSLFEAISTIAEKRIANLKYDKTIICTVTNIDNAKNNLYTVSDGSVIFEAQGNGVQYKVGDSVRVLILEGDFTKEKYIQGKHNTKEADKPITYVSAMDSIIDLTENLLKPDDAEKIVGIAANSATNEVEIARIDLTQNQKFDVTNSDIFNTIYLKGDFWSAFDQYEMRSGDYGLHVVIGIVNGPKSFDRLDLRLSALKDMFGNPYAFKVFTPQEITFKLSSWPQNAKTIQVYLYQNQNFKYYDYSKATEESVALTKIGSTDKEIANIKVKNVQLGFGSQISSIADNTLQIYTNNTQSFDHRRGASDSYNKKTMQVLWYNKTEDNEYIGFSDGIYEEDGYLEDKYLEEISTDMRLINIRDNEKYKDIPHDENCLDLQASILEIEEYITEAAKLVGSDLWHILDQFKNNVSGLTFKEDPWTGNIKTITAAAAEMQDDLETLKQYYTDILERAKKNERWPTEQTKKRSVFSGLRKKIGRDLVVLHNKFVDVAEDVSDKVEDGAKTVTSYYTTIKDTVDDIEEAVKTQVDATAQYIDTYTTYANQLARLLTKIEELVAKNKVYLNNAIKLLELVKDDDKTEIKIDSDYGSKTTHDDFIKANENRYCLYWYEKDITVRQSDGIMPAGWKRLTDKTNKGLPEQGNTGYYQKSSKTGVDIILSEAVFSKTYVAVLFYNHEKFVSNELTFKNDSETLTSAEINNGGTIIIEHGQNSQEAYQAYNEYGLLLNAADGGKIRKLRAYYAFNGEVEQLDEKNPNSYLNNAYIYWRVPSGATQLVIRDSDVTGFSKITDQKHAQYKDGYITYCKVINKSTFESDTTFPYRIKGEYFSTNTQNHIICDVIKQGKITEKEAKVDVPATGGDGAAAGAETEKMSVTEEEIETVTYSATMYFNFSSFGNQGTDYTLTLNSNYTQIMALPAPQVDKADDAATTKHTEDALEIISKLYDFKGNEITIEYSEKGNTFTWFGPAGGYTIPEVIETGGKVTGCKLQQNIRVKGQEPIYWGVLQCTIKDLYIATLNKNINLTSYYPIPYAFENKVYIEGAGTVMYSSAGNNPQHYKNPYKLYYSKDILETKDGKTTIVAHTGEEWTVGSTPAKWKIRYYYTEKSGDDTVVKWYDGAYDASEGVDKYVFTYVNNEGKTVSITQNSGNITTEALYRSSRFVPRLDKENCLVVSNTYIDDKTYPVVMAIHPTDGSVLWAQPLLIRKNRHASALMNGWDGTLKVDKDSNTILTSMVGAGRKNKNNEFEGVLMGEVKNASDITTLGIYGFNDGEQSFGFKIDGTGFIGKSGKGQILFNGNNSTIKSQSYDTGTGMELDLDDGIIDIKNSESTVVYLNGNDGAAFIEIKTPPNAKNSAGENVAEKTLLKASSSECFLQSANYAQSTATQSGRGLKLDLTNETLDSYNFKLTSNNVLLDSSTGATTFFEIKDGSQTTLFKASSDTNGYYLQSSNYSETSDTGVRIDLNGDGGFKLKTSNIYLGDTPNKNNYYFKIGNGLTVDNNYNLSVTGNINATSGYFHNVQIYGKNPTNLLTKVNDQTYKIACGNFDNDSFEITTQGTGYRLTGAEANAISTVSGFYEALNGDKTHYPTWHNNYLRMLFTAEPGEELYYRITAPSIEVKNFGLTKGKKYILSGQISLQKYEDTSPSSFDPTGNIDRVTVRTERSKNGAFSGGINTKILDDFTTTSKVSDAGGVANRDWGEPTFEDFAVEFIVEDDADNYYISFQLYPTISNANTAACLCLKDLKLYEAGLCGEISPENGFALWKGLKGSGSTEGDEDKNLLFKVDENGAFLRGQIHATAGGTVGGWNIGGNYLITNNSLGQSNAFHMYSEGAAGTVAGVTLSSTSDEQWMLGIGSHFGVTNTGALYARAGNIAGFYINSQDMTIYTDNTTSGIENVLGFISKGTQTGKYAVGSSVLKQNWFIWNKGGANGSAMTETDADGNVTAEGIKGVFGVDMDGNLYAMAGQIGPWSLGSTYLKYMSGNTADDNKRDYIALSQDSIATKSLEATKGRLGYAYFGHKSNSNVYSEGYISQKTDYKCFLEWYSGSSASTSELTYWVGLTPSHLVRCSFLNQEPVKDTIKTIDWEKLIISSTAGQVDHVYDGAFPHGTVSLGSGLGLAYGRIDLNEDANFELYNVNTYLDGVLAFNIIPQAWGSADLTITLAVASGGGLNTKYTSDQTQANFAKEENFTSAPGWVPIVWNKGSGQGPRDAFYMAIGYIAQ